ncbi:MAG: hypothetical protein MUC72_11350 [Acidobacteria bacterium]|nr:hypothetical protein [Acidobacteriota bacterium]
MKKITLPAAILFLTLPCFSFFPFFHGARSLALGYSSLAFNYDVNALHLNPALLGSLAVPLGGYQYDSSSLDFRDISGRLAAARAFGLDDFAALAEKSREAVLAELNAAFSADSAINGFRMRGPGYAGKGYALSIATVDAAIVRPLDSPVLAKPVAEISNADIASLRVRFTGFHYSDYALAVAFPVSQGLAVGATLHYLKGRNTVFDAALSAAPLAGGADAAELLEAAWSDPGNGFSKFNFDLGAGIELGQHFKAGFVVKNAGDPVIATEAGELRLARRLVAGLVFRPDAQLGIYLDVDLAKGDLFHNGEEVQPFSLGVEKGLFQNKLFLRAGLLSDLAAKYFVGRKANVLYGFGCGFNLGNFLIDLALGLDPQGRVKNLGVSGFYAIR